MSPAAAVLHREAFTTSRLLEFFSEKELVLQTGHEVELWPLAIVKELVDNGLDSAEEHNILPEIVIEVTRRSIAVSDNGAGIPMGVITSILDFSSRTSSRDFYISPSRGQQGNAAKVILAAPFVLSGGVRGDVTITTQGQQHAIRTTVDRVAQAPHVAHVVTRAPVGKGTRIEVRWPDLASRILSDARPRFLQIVQAFALFNPAATFRLRDGKTETVFPRTMDRVEKWLPSWPTSPHWYDAEQLRSLLRAYVANERQGGRPKTIREFIAEFRGLTSTAKQKQILAALRCRGEHVADLVVKGDVEMRFCERLLSLLQDHSTPVKPAALGVLGEAHSKAGLHAEHLHYWKAAKVDEATGRPFVVEIAFTARKEDGAGLRLITGINHSPCLVDPFRSLSEYGVGLQGLLGSLHVRAEDPITFVLHLVSPHLRYTDRGKSSLEGL